MRTKVTLVLVFLNVALFFFIFRFERHWRTEDNWQEARRRVLGAEAADIRSFTITGPGPTLELVKRGDTWFVTQPIEWPANDNAVKRIINELQFLEHETSFSVADLAKNGQSLADYGLDHPKLTLTFISGGPDVTGEPGRPLSLRLGDTTKDGQRLYVLSPDGQRIHVVSQSLATTLAMTFAELHSDQIFTIPVFEARSLNLQTAAPANLRIRLRRDGSRWTFETPIIARASKNATELVINALNGLRVKSFITDQPPARLPEDNPSLRISLEGRNRRETLALGDPAPPGTPTDGGTEYYAQLEGRSALFTVIVPTGLLNTLTLAQDKLRETHILDFDTHAVTAVTLTAPNHPPLTLQRLESGAASADLPSWQIVLRGDDSQAPQVLPADRSAVTRLLDQLSLLTAKKFQSDAPRDADLEAWGFNQPEREITLTVAGTPATTITLQIGLPTQRDGFAYARVKDNSASIYAVDPDILGETSVTPRSWRERLLRELPAGARISALKLTDLSTHQVLLDTAIDAAGHFSPVPADPQAVQMIVGQLHTLRAKEFVLDRFSDRVEAAGVERPWRFQLDATITLTGGAGEQTSTTTLFLAPRDGGDRQLAGSPEFNAVFTIEQPLLDALWPITEAPRDPGPPAENPPPSA